MIIQALNALGINSEFCVDGNVTTEEHYLRTYRDLTNQNRFFEWSVVSAKIAELQALEPLRLLREQRNQLLAQSDWMAVPDRTATQAQIDYRQALRDLPSTADPQLDENGNLTNVTWPERPE
jgi:hypothetical protein